MAVCLLMPFVDWLTATCNDYPGFRQAPYPGGAPLSCQRLAKQWAYYCRVGNPIGGGDFAPCCATCSSRYKNRTGNNDDEAVCCVTS